MNIKAGTTILRSSWIYLIILTFLFSCRTNAQVDRSEIRNIDPFRLFDISGDSLMNLKPNGMPGEILTESGQKHKVIEHQEKWFSFGEIRVDYFIVLNKIVQINLYLPKNIKREQAVKNITSYLGVPFATNIASKGSSPKFSAQWITSGVSYGLNDYGDSIDVFINQSVLYNYNVFNIPAGSYVIEKISADVTGDNIKDYVSLVGHRYNTKSVYYDKLYFIIYDGKTKKESVTDFPKEYNSAYSPTMRAVKFTNKKFPEIFFTGITGSSGGITNYLVYSFNHNKAELLFSPDSLHILHITGQLEDGYNAAINVKETNKNYTLSVLQIKKELDEHNIYVAGRVNKKADVWMNAYEKIETKDANKDGLSELYGIQGIKCLANYMTIGYAKSTWKYIKNKFVLVDSEVTGIGK